MDLPVKNPDRPVMSRVAELSTPNTQIRVMLNGVECSIKDVGFNPVANVLTIVLGNPDEPKVTDHFGQVITP